MSIGLEVCRQCLRTESNLLLGSICRTREPQTVGAIVVAIVTQQDNGVFGRCLVKGLLYIVKSPLRAIVFCEVPLPYCQPVAFIGFEDNVNMAEEVRDPTHTLPRAILLSLLITSLLYALVSWAAVRAVPLERLAVSEQPLALVWSHARGGGAAFLSVIAVAAAMNGILAQIVMASRVLFGVGKRSPALAVFHHAHPRLGTPVLATAVIGVLVIFMAVTLPVADLAEATSAILLAVFVLVNSALIAMKRAEPEAPFRVPMVVPVLGLLGSLGALAISFGAVS